MTFCSNFPLCFSAYPSSIIKFFCLMDLHYSQTHSFCHPQYFGFTTLWIYTILKPVVPRPWHIPRFTTLWIYTILKLLFCSQLMDLCFTTLWIYTILKRTGTLGRSAAVLLPYEFTLFSNCVFSWFLAVLFYYLMNLHYSQTLEKMELLWFVFYYLMNLHYSQTTVWAWWKNNRFYYLMNLHYSQTDDEVYLFFSSVLLPYEFTLFSNAVGLKAIVT